MSNWHDVSDREREDDREGSTCRCPIPPGRSEPWHLQICREGDEPARCWNCGRETTDPRACQFCAESKGVTPEPDPWQVARAAFDETDVEF